MEVEVLWDDDDDPKGNVQHVARHGLTPAEVEEILLDDSLPTAVSRSTGRPCKFGYTSTDRYIIVVWSEVGGDPSLLYPVTAYDVPEPS